MKEKVDFSEIVSIIKTNGYSKKSILELMSEIPNNYYTDFEEEAVNSLKYYSALCVLLRKPIITTANLNFLKSDFSKKFLKNSWVCEHDEMLKLTFDKFYPIWEEAWR